MMDRSKVEVILGNYDSLFSAVLDLKRMVLTNYRNSRKKLSILDSIRFCTEYGYKITRGYDPGTYCLIAVHDKEIYEKVVGM